MSVSRNKFFATVTPFRLVNFYKSPRRYQLESVRISASQSKTIENQFRTIYGISLRNIIVKNKPIGNFGTKLKRIIPLTASNKCLIKQNHDENSRSKNIPNKFKTDCKNLVEKYLKKIKILNTAKFEQRNIGYLFAEFFDDLRNFIPDCDRLFVAMKKLTGSLNNKSANLIPSNTEKEKETSIESARSSQEMVKIASLKRMSLPGNSLFNRLKANIKVNQVQKNSIRSEERRVGKE